MSDIYLDIKDLSKHLKIKRSTLYAWVSQGKIPHVKVHSLIRFQKEEIDRWLESFKKDNSTPSPIIPEGREKAPLDILIDRAKRDVYNTQRGKTGPLSRPGREG
ncbi:MAG: helix-turn-helix domain-containing protein [Nitrospirae bacterium]|nr:helix-turn-helix domain-containing protein [Nitrospirota bacterium]